MKKETIITVILSSLLVLSLVLDIASEAFVFSAMLHICFHLLLLFVVIRIVHKYLKKDITDGMKKAIHLCYGVMLLDLVVVDAIRYILTNGGYTVLFLPVCVPICFMIIMHQSAKEAGSDKPINQKWTYIIGIPLLIIALFFEIISFM